MDLCIHTYIITCVGQKCVRDYVIRLLETFKRDYIVHMLFFSKKFISFINQILFIIYTPSLEFDIGFQDVYEIYEGMCVHQCVIQSESV